jgi:hypothetical protein
MAIANVVQRGWSIYVYDEYHNILFFSDAGSGPNDGLKGYTGSSVSIRRGSFIYVYDERGRLTSSTDAAISN